ncbi:MAG: S-layer homology domain-containing protein [Oscillospiraceae bacterium]|jgi:uncharacterized protein YjdB|nr:S-layer homology domain-containing protein [Oscillospiraceae bacterium]
MKVKIKSLCRINLLAALIAAAIFAAIVPSAFADHDSVVDKSESLEVYVISGGRSTLLHEYNISELEDIANTEQAYYSSVDAMPARVLTIASGVTIDAIVTDCSRKYNSENLDLADFAYVNFEASDGWSRAYDSDEIYDAGRYYYGGLFETNSFNSISNSGWTVNVSEVTSGYHINVEPMLAILSVQGRVFDSDDFDDIRNSGLSDDDSLRFCIGQTESDLRNGVSTTSQFGRGIVTMEIIMDEDYEPAISVTGITLSDDRKTISVGETAALTAGIVPRDATNSRVRWSSSDSSVASVGGNGSVTGEKAGTAVITARSAGNLNYAAECIITVVSGNASDGGGGGGGASAETTSPEPSETPVSVTEIAEPKVYGDVQSGDWFASAVDFVSAQGLMKGKGDGSAFAPNDLNTRAEWIMVMARMKGASAANTTSSPWYKAVLDWAIEDGITDGSSPTEPITREQVIVMMWRLKGEPATRLDSSILAESDRVSGWAEGGMLWAIEENIILGDARGYAGKDNITRAEAAAILMRYLQE